MRRKFKNTPTRVKRPLRKVEFILKPTVGITHRRAMDSLASRAVASTTVLKTGPRSMRSPRLSMRRVGASRDKVLTRMGHGDSSMSEDEDDYASDINRTPYYTQTERKFLDMITIQALKNLLHFLQETNGEMHMYLHNHITENPFELSETRSMEDWLTDLAAKPLTRVNDPRRSSVPGPAMDEEALRKGREISPRDLVERILQARSNVAEELTRELSAPRLAVKNNKIFTAALASTFRLSDDDV